MPFEFSGEAPSLGSTSNAFSPFSFAAPPSTTLSRPLTFSGAPSFGGTPALSKTSSFATASPVMQSSQTAKFGETPPQIEHIAGQPSSEPTAAPRKPKDDPLSRSLYRTKHQRPAIFGADIAADGIISTYLDKLQGDEDVGQAECADKLEMILNDLVESRPDAMRFLHHIFECATKSNTELTKSRAIESRYREEAGNIPSEAPDVYTDIHAGSRLYKACQTAINNRMRGDSYYHYNSYYTIGADVTSLIAHTASRADVRQFLSTGAYGKFIPSTNLAKDVDEFVDEIYDILLKVKKQFKHEWKVEGRDEASYFGKGFNRTKPEGSVHLPGGPVYLWDDSLKEVNPSGRCCPWKSADVTANISPPAMDNKPFRFMDLPAELRNHVYRKGLAPGTVSLVSCSHYNPRGTTPSLTTNLLATCKQVHKEAADLLFENKFLVTFCPDFFGYSRPAIHRTQLPLHALSKIKSLVLVVECIRFEKINCDPNSLQALTSLESLRIIALEEDAHQKTITVAQLSTVLQEIVTRIPASCDVFYGSTPGREEDFTDQMLRVFINKSLKNDRVSPFEKGKETDVAKLKAAAQSVPDDVVQGSKSGEPPTRRSLPGDLRGLPKLLA